MKTDVLILFRCDGSTEIGLGHVVRCLALADELCEAHGCRVAFAMRQGPLGAAMVREKGYPVFEPVGKENILDQARWLEKVVSIANVGVLVLDVRDDLPRDAIQALRNNGILIVTLDDPSERRLVADLAFYPPVPQVKKLNWKRFTGQLYTGWEWVVLRKEFSRGPCFISHNCPQVLVTMGGSDPAGLTLKAVEALELIDEDFHADVVLGRGFSYDSAFGNLLARTRRHFTIRRDVQNMADLMAQADLAIASFGITAYELAAMGIPAIYICLTDDHAESARAFVDAGIAFNLGKFCEITPEILAWAVFPVLINSELRRRMSARASALVDGRGVNRVAECIVREMKKRYA